LTIFDVLTVSWHLILPERRQETMHVQRHHRAISCEALPRRQECIRNLSRPVIAPPRMPVPVLDARQRAFEGEVQMITQLPGEPSLASPAN
jgi:hypothetical protein